MLETVESALNGARMVPCPACGERALSSGPRSDEGITMLRCGRCDAISEALADIDVIAISVRVYGGCCAGFRRYLLRWSAAGAAPRTLEFESWAQDHVVLHVGDRASLLFSPGSLERGGKRLPMPLIAANHTTHSAWALVGSAPIATLR